jgi:FkbM family methyltransferase
MFGRNTRERVKRVRFVGPLLYNVYLRLFHAEGQVLILSGTYLKGKRWIRFTRTHWDDYVTGNYEIPVQKALAAHLRPGMVFYDVGANSGFFTLLGACLVGDRGRVVAYEPHSIVAAHLRKQMRANNVSHYVDVVTAAVCDQNGTAFFTDGDASVMNTLVNATVANRKITVKTVTLDEDCKVRPKPGLIKIDVEGAELQVLRGAINLIRAFRPILLVELHCNKLATQYDAMIEELGYRTEDLQGRPISAARSGERHVISFPV